jgi:hypothetical protein
VICVGKGALSATAAAEANRSDAYMENITPAAPLETTKRIIDSPVIA